MKKFKFLVILIFLNFGLFSFGTLNNAYALDFQPNEIISNNDLLEYDSMDLDAVQDFLNNQTGMLKDFQTTDYFGVERSAAEIIYNASQAYKISPKWILTTLQKEQSLVSNPNPTKKNVDWAMGYAVCDSCSVDDPQVALFKGFGTQVDRATYRVRYYTDNPEKFNFRVGNLYNIDGTDVMINNQATANLYIYTPHIHGNYNYWLVWNRWFAKIYPDGSLLKQEGVAGVWLIENGKRRPFWSKVALQSRYSDANVIEVSRNDLQRYEVGFPIKYPNYSLLKSTGGKIYLTVNNEKKEIESEEVFRTIGYNYDEVVEVTDEELSYYSDGRNITLNSMYPQGALLQDKTTGGVFYVEDGIKYPVLAKEVLAINYQNYKLTPVSAEELSKYVTAANGVKLRDGTLVKLAIDSKVYVISNGQRRWLANEQTFNQLGYEWSDIITINDKLATLHPVGETLDLLMPTNTQIAFK